MNITWACLLLVGGLVVLWKAADLLVAGAVGLAQRLGNLTCRKEAVRAVMCFLYPTDRGDANVLGCRFPEVCV
jgi:Ca2+/Na+ antiporter